MYVNYDLLSDYVTAECKRCGKEIKIKKDLCKNFPKGYQLKKPRKCACGEISDFIERRDVSDSSPKCPRCGSTRITANKKGFGFGKAVGGAVLTGGIGLLAGFLGSDKIKITCLSCGYDWKPGK